MASTTLPRLIGADTVVPCVDGRPRRYVNLDYAASTPVMAAVWDALEAFVPWYSSVHRGSGLKSQVSTTAFEDARDTVAEFVGAGADETVVFVRNTTEAINLLSVTLRAGTRVLSSPVEHHSNMLPWRRHDLRLLPFTRSRDDLLDACEGALRAARPRIDLVAVTGASNVTGEVWPVAELAELAHAHGARLFVDAAQLAPHRPIDMAGAGIDWLALSGHKLYAPFGAGALVGDGLRLGEVEPLLHGGGAIELVTPDDVIWADAPERHEAGSPNVVGAVALAAACRALLELGMDVVAAHERALSARLWSALRGVPGLRRLTLWPDESDRVGVASFNLDGYRHPLLAAILSAEHAIGVRHGCFCAHPLMTRLLGIPDGELVRLAAELRAGRRPALPGAVRASLGLGTTLDDIDRLIDALCEIAAVGPRSRYLHLASRDEYQPDAADTPTYRQNTPQKEPRMARITTLELDPIEVNVANAKVAVHFDVTYSQFDRDANTPYRMVCSLVGHDAALNPSGEVGETPADDVLQDGTLTPPGGQIIRADGQVVQHFDLSKLVALESLNEDHTIPSNEGDEIKAHVQLTPIVANATEAESGLQTLTIE